MFGRRALLSAAVVAAAARSHAQEQPGGEGALVAGEIQVPVPGGSTVPGYRARPAGDGPFPVVLVLSDGPGIPAWLAGFCRRLAQAGYCAIAADVLGAGTDDDALLALDLVARSVGDHGGDPARVALTGFGAGGRATWLYAAHSPALKAAVAWYGAVGGASTPDHPNSPLDVAGDLRAPLLGLYGKNDPASPERLLLQAERKAEAGGRTIELIAYVGAGAAFAAEGSSTYRKAAALDGWERMLGWFKNHGAQ